MMKITRNFASKNLSPFYRTYGLSIAISLVALLLIIGLKSVFTVSFLLVFFPAVCLSTWAGGFRGGILTVATILLGTIFLASRATIQTNIPLSSQLLQNVIAAAEGIFISFIIDRVSHGDQINRFKTQERNQLRQILNLQEAHEKALTEIRARDEFLSIASHELKTPLTTMLLQLQTILHNIRNVSLANFSIENLLKMLESAEQQTQRLAKMINDLLDTSLITTQRLELDLEQVDLSEILQDTVERFSEKLIREGIKIYIDAEDNVVGVWDKMRLEQAISNLVTNAIKYGEKKPISIRLQNHNATAKITVTDRGIGIPAEHQKRIFARFERAVDSNDIKGLGVGLYITSQIVRAHRGKILLKSKPGKGSSFTIELPLSTSKLN